MALLYRRYREALYVRPLQFALDMRLSPYEKCGCERRRRKPLLATAGLQRGGAGVETAGCCSATADQIKVKAEIFIPRSLDFGYKKDADSARRLPNADMRISPSDQSWLPRFGCVYDGVIQLFRLDDHYEQDQSVEMKNLSMIKSNFLPASGRVKNSIIAFLHPLRRPISWACQRRLLPSGIRHLLPWRWALEPFSVYGQDWKFLWVPAEFDDIVHGLFWSGLCSFESETMSVIMGQIRQARCFIDVGANCGIYTVLGATINKQIQIIAIEPVPRICAALVRNVSQNKFDTRITILNIAAGNCDAIVDFHEAEYAGMGSLAVQGYQGQPGRLIRVQCRKLDSVATELNIEPDLIKIDVEGFSDAVLSGASRLLDRVRPRIVLEANPGDPVLRITEILTTHRYAMHLITDNGPELREEITASAKYRNWLCLPLGQDDRKVPMAGVEV